MEQFFRERTQSGVITEHLERREERAFASPSAARIHLVFP